MKFPLSIQPASWKVIAFVTAGMIVTAISFYFSPGVIPLFLIWGCVIAGGIFILGRLKGHDLGLFWQGIKSVNLYLACLWVLAQLVVLATGILAGIPMVFSIPPIGELISFLLAFAMAEEIIFRGFLFPQIFLQLSRSARKPWVNLITALISTQAFFALAHLPQCLLAHMTAKEILLNHAMALTWGIAFCFVYWRSRNLLFAVALHALANLPTLIFGNVALEHDVLVAIVISLGLLLVEAWARWRDRPKPVRSHEKVIKTANAGSL